MEINAFVRTQLTDAHTMLRAALRGATDEQLAWQPPGHANRAGAVYLHLLAAEDGFVQGLLQSRPRLWDAEGWGARLGIGTLTRLGDWSGLDGVPITLAALEPYRQAVQAASLEYADRFDPAELERPVEYAGRTVPLAEVLARVAVHGCLHAGEIAALRGAQGVAGLPF